MVDAPPPRGVDAAPPPGPVRLLPPGGVRGTAPARRPDAGRAHRAVLRTDGRPRADPFAVIDRTRAAASVSAPPASTPTARCRCRGPWPGPSCSTSTGGRSTGGGWPPTPPSPAVVARPRRLLPARGRCARSSPAVPARPAAAGRQPGEDLLVVARLDPIKRVDLAIDALRHSTTPTTAPSPWSVRAPTGTASRPWPPATPGSASRTRRRPGRCRAVPTARRAVVVTPQDEDFGYVTLEAQQHGRPVLTVTDAGGPVELATDDADGLVMAPAAAAVAGAMTRLRRRPGRTLGHAAWATAPAAPRRPLVAGRGRAPARAHGRGPAGAARRGRLVAVSTYPIHGWPGGGPERAGHLLGALAEDGWDVNMVGLTVGGGTRAVGRSRTGFGRRRCRCRPATHDAEVRLRRCHGQRLRHRHRGVAAVAVHPRRSPASCHAALVGADRRRPRAALPGYPAVAALAPDVPLVFDAHNHEAHAQGRDPARHRGRPVAARPGGRDRGPGLRRGPAGDGDHVDGPLRPRHRPLPRPRPHRRGPQRRGHHGRARSPIPRSGPASGARMLDRLGGAPARQLAVFVGSGHSPNIEAGPGADGDGAPGARGALPPGRPPQPVPRPTSRPRQRPPARARR